MMDQTLCRILAGDAHLVPWSAFALAEWHALRYTAQAEGVAPLLYHIWKTTCWPAEMPPEVRTAFTQAYYASAARNALLYSELARVLAALAANGGTTAEPRWPTALIEGSAVSAPPSAVILKGAALALTVYPDPALRPLSDIDLLVPRERLQRAVETVQALGYIVPYPEMSPGLNRIAGHHVHLRGGPQQRVILELHWNLIGGDADWRTPSLDWFWQQTEPFSRSPISNLQFTILTPTAHLLYLAAHLALQHGAGQAPLVWYYDLHLLVTRCGERADWDELLARAQEFRWAAALYTALRDTRQRFATPLPDGFLGTLAEARDRQAARSVARKASPTQTRALRILDNWIAHGWSARLRLAWAILCPSPAYMRWRYKPQPTWLWPLYYPYRWLDILWDGLRTLWRIVGGRWRRRDRW